VRELLKRGLAAEGFQTAKSGSKSKNFSIIEGSKTEARKRR